MPEWRVCWSSFPKEEIIYFVQVLIAYTVIIVSLVNLCLTTEHSAIWGTLVSGCIGYLFPAPTLNHGGQPVLHTPTQ